MGTSFLRTALLLIPLAAALACWYACPGLPDWSLARELLREQRRGEALERWDRSVKDCLEAKALVTAEVIRDGLPLAEAARRFEAASEGLEGNNIGRAGASQRLSGEQGLCQNVLRWVGRVPADSRQAAALARLEEEYRQRFGAPAAE